MLSLLFLSFAYAQNVEVTLKDYPFNNPEQATLSIMAYDFTLDKFDRKGEDSKVELQSGKILSYKTWLQKNPAPLVVVLPAFGSHFKSSTTLRLAETLYNKGYSVAAMSNVFNFEFMENALSSALPGYTPKDAQDVHNTLRAIIDDIKTDNRDVQIQKIGVAGYSHGALLTLFLANIEDQLGDMAIGISSFVAINPPIDLDYSLKFIDDSYSIKSWSQEKRALNILNAALKTKEIAYASPEEQTKILSQIPRDQARVAIGTSFRLNLHEILQVSLFSGKLDELIASGQLQDLNIDRRSSRRSEIYKVIEKNYSFTRYMNDVLIAHLLNSPYYVSYVHGKTAADLIYDSGLRSIENTLRTNSKIKIIHNKDDILMLTPEKLDWLKQVAGSKLILFDKGGHVGNLHVPEVQNIFIESLF